MNGNQLFRKSFTFLFHIPVRFMSKERAVKAVKPGVSLVIDDTPHKVIKIIQGKRGKGGGFVKATMKSLPSGSIFEKTFSSDDVVELADVEKEMVQYSWKDENDLVFLNSSTFEEVRVNVAAVEAAEWLAPGMEVRLNTFRDQVLDVVIPVNAEYTVTKIDLIKASGKEAPALLDCGAVIMVPEFITPGTKVKVNTETRTYVSRADT